MTSESAVTDNDDDICKHVPADEINEHGFATCAKCGWRYQPVSAPAAKEPVRVLCIDTPETRTQRALTKLAEHAFAAAKESGVRRYMGQHGLPYDAEFVDARDHDSAVAALAAQVEQLRAQLSAALRDQRRYQFIRDHGCEFVVLDDDGHLKLLDSLDASIDSAIDSAMEKQT